SSDELRRRLGAREPANRPHHYRPHDHDRHNRRQRDLPASVDWRTSGLVTPVKDQGQCGSCWAFSATGAMEAANMKRYGTLVSLSEQHLVDCSGAYGNTGCDGGFPDQAFSFAADDSTEGSTDTIKQYGVDKEDDYAYTSGSSGNTGTCRFSALPQTNTGTGFKDVDPTEAALQEAVATQGPISVAIDASDTSFQFYSEGTYAGPCSQPINHAMLVVGYGTNATD
ncbi:unnamed protein product, partial [Sphagnum balticum]